MIPNIRLYARSAMGLQKYLLEHAESYEEALKVVRDATGHKRVLAVVSGGKTH